MLYVDRDYFTFSFTIWIPFFFLVIVLTSTWSTVLNGSGKSKHSCLVPDFEKKAFSFSTLSILVVGFSYMAFIIHGWAKVGLHLSVWKIQ